MLVGCGGDGGAATTATRTSAAPRDPERAAQAEFERDARKDTSRSEYVGRRSRGLVALRRPPGFRIVRPDGARAMWSFVPIATPSDQEGVVPDNVITLARWVPDRPARTARALADDFAAFFRREIPSEKPRVDPRALRRAGLRMAVVRSRLGGPPPLRETSYLFLARDKGYQVSCAASPAGAPVIAKGCDALLDSLRPARR